MNITVLIPDDLAVRLNFGGDIARRALEAFAAEEYRVGRLTKPELRQLLGFAVLNEIDGFLKARGIYQDYGIVDLERERADMALLGLDEPESVNLPEAIRRRFASVGGVDDLVIPPREPGREPPRFDR